MPDYHRPHHRIITGVLASLDAKFLASADCFFGGGTQIALAYGEFRESRDIDFLCGSRAGFRLLRETVTERSLGAVSRRPLKLGREVRADRDGVRTFVEAGESRIKLEIVLEARIDIHGTLDRSLGVPVLDLTSRIAEKLLANADRGLDRATRSRDLIDLAFVAAHHTLDELRSGLFVAETAYGVAIRRDLASVLNRLSEERAWLADCVRSLGIDDTAPMRRGLARLRRLLGTT